MKRIALNFHGLGEPHAGVDADERPYWLSFDQFDALLDLVWASSDPGRFEFTFDDGNASDLAAAERLAQRGVSARFFVLVGRMGAPHYLSHADLKSLRGAGMVVGLHGRWHLDWRQLDAATFADETVAARRELAGLLGEPVDEVAIPFGAYNRRVLQGLKDQGFARIHTSDRGLLPRSDARIWNRNTIRNDMDEATLAQIVSGTTGLALAARRAVGSFVRRNLR